MIVSRLSGGLGNQLFQYATGRSLAARTGAELKLDSSWIDARDSKAPGRYELGCFAVDAEVSPVWKVGRLRASKSLRRALQAVRPSRRPFLRVIVEPSDLAFEPAVLAAGDNTYLVGYWQFEEYFKEHEALIRRELQFVPRLRVENARLAREIERANAVSVHVRRGDYVTSERHSRMIGALTPDYYRQAVDFIAERVGDIRLFVFSDDPAWCAANLRFRKRTVLVEHNSAPERAFEDLRLMSLCSHHVIANSTFSWWGAWLNPSRTKLIVAPRQWLRDPVLNRTRSLPHGWIRL